MKELFEKCLAAAKAVVQAEKDLWPGCENAVNIINIGGGGSSSDTAYDRHGTSGTQISYSLPSLISGLVQDNASASTSSPALANTQNNVFSSVMGGRNLDPQGVLQAQQGINPTTFSGSANLSAIAARDPFSTQFAQDTQAAYEQRASDAMAQAATGPDAVRGGAARTPIAQGVMSERLAQGRGQELRQAQQSDYGMASGASQLGNMIEMARRGLQFGAQGAQAGQQLQSDQNALTAAGGFDRTKASNLGALQLASDLLGVKNAMNTEAMTGKGSGGTVGYQGGISL